MLTLRLDLIHTNYNGNVTITTYSSTDGVTTLSPMICLRIRRT